GTGIRPGRKNTGKLGRVCCRSDRTLSRRRGRTGGNEGVPRTAKAPLDRKNKRDMIRKVLIANRGENAVRIAHTLREMRIATVVVFTAPDQNALHVRSADEARTIASYLDAQDIVRVAQECGADAIHPGYGFLSENPDFSAACEQNGITFIGPRPTT